MKSFGIGVLYYLLSFFGYPLLDKVEQPLEVVQDKVTETVQDRIEEVTSGQIIPNILDIDINIHLLHEKEDSCCSRH